MKQKEQAQKLTIVPYSSFLLSVLFSLYSDCKNKQTNSKKNFPILEIDLLKLSNNSTTLFVFNPSSTQILQTSQNHDQNARTTYWALKFTSTQNNNS